MQTQRSVRLNNPFFPVTLSLYASNDPSHLVHIDILKLSIMQHFALITPMNVAHLTNGVVSQFSDPIPLAEIPESLLLLLPPPWTLFVSLINLRDATQKMAAIVHLGKDTMLFKSLLAESGAEWRNVKLYLFRASAAPLSLEQLADLSSEQAREAPVASQVASMLVEDDATVAQIVNLLSRSVLHFKVSSLG